MPSGNAADTSAGNGWVAATIGPGSAGWATGITTGPEQAVIRVPKATAANVLCVMVNMGSTFFKLRVALDGGIGCRCRLNQDKPAVGWIVIAAIPLKHGKG